MVQIRLFPKNCFILEMLKLNYHYVYQFDFLDKKFLQANNNAIREQFIQIKSILNLKNATKNLMSLTLSFLLETLGNQRFFFKNAFSKFTQNLIFKITLRKQRIFLFLDLCLGSFFILSTITDLLYQIKITENIQFFIHNFLLNKLPYLIYYTFSLKFNFKYRLSSLENFIFNSLA